MPDLGRKIVTRVVLPYAVFSAAWIYLSDRILASGVADAALLSRLQTYKGLAFIVITTALLYGLLRRELKKRELSNLWRNDQRRVMTQIVAGTPLNEILATLVLALEHQIKGALGSIMLLDTDGMRLRYGAGPNLPAGLGDAIDGMQVGPACGACGTATHEKRLVVIEDFQTDPRGRLPGTGVTHGAARGLVTTHHDGRRRGDRHFRHLSPQGIPTARTG